MNKPCFSTHNVNPETKEFTVFVNGKVIADVREMLDECLKCNVDVRGHCDKSRPYFIGLLANKIK